MLSKPKIMVLEILGLKKPLIIIEDPEILWFMLYLAMNKYLKFKLRNV